jgi:hypothetical protein
MVEQENVSHLKLFVHACARVCYIRSVAIFCYIRSNVFHWFSACIVFLDKITNLDICDNL